jgi:hypothetical protein
MLPQIHKSHPKRLDDRCFSAYLELPVSFHVFLSGSPVRAALLKSAEDHLF